MRKINPELFERLRTHLGVQKSRLYELISTRVRATHLEPHLAAIVLASENGINTSKYASSEDLAEIRGAQPSRPHALAQTPPPQPLPRGATKRPDPVTLDLSIVRNKALRRILQRDVAELNAISALGLEKTTKTCIVLTGSIAEALILVSLLRRRKAAIRVAAALPGNVSSNPEDWDLYTMVSIAAKLKPSLLPDDAITGATQLRKWRNLVHPGRELKDARNIRVTPTKARARNAISFLQFIGDELAS